MRYFKLSPIVLFLMLISSKLLAQKKIATDSIYKHLNLEEVTITEKLNGNDALLKFYKSSKTSSTEEVLGRVASVNLIRRGSYGMEPTIRGFSPSQVNLTLDGIKIFGACTDHMDPPTSYIETSNLKSIQLATSANSGKFGSNIGGSLNLELAQAQLGTAKPLTGEISSSFASVSNSTNNVMQFNYGAENWGLRLSGVYRNAGNYTAQNREILFTQYQKLNFSANAKYRLKSNAFLSLDLLADDGWDIGYAALPMDVSSAKARIYALTYKTFPKNSDFNYFEMKLYGNNITHSMDDTKRPQIPMHMDMPGWSDTYGAYAETALNWRANALFTLRLDGYHNFTRAEMTMYPENSAPMFMLTWPDVANTSVGVYLNNDFQISKLVKWSINSRLEYTQSKVKSELGRKQLEVFNYEVDAPRQKLLKNFNSSVIYQPNKFYTSISLGYGERSATTNELYGFYLFNASDGYDYIGNPDLKNERSFNGELSFSHKAAKSDLNITFFANRIQQYTLGAFRPEVGVMTIGANGTKFYEQVPHAFLMGFETSLNTKLMKNLQLISNLRYTQGQDNKDEPLPLIAPLKLTSSMRYSKSNYSFTLENQWASAQQRVNRYVNESTTPAYVLFNFRSSYQFKVKQNKLEVNAGVENIFDTYYQEHLDWGNIPRPGRNIVLGLSCGF